MIHTKISFYLTLFPGWFVESWSPYLWVPSWKTSIRGGVQQRNLQENYQSWCQVSVPRQHRGQGPHLEVAQEGSKSEAVLGGGDGTCLDQEQYLETRRQLSVTIKYPQCIFYVHTKVEFLCLSDISSRQYCKYLIQWWSHHEIHTITKVNAFSRFFLHLCIVSGIKT